MQGSERSVSERAELCPPGARFARPGRLAPTVKGFIDPRATRETGDERALSIVRFEDLACWQEATSLAVEIYAVSKDGEFGRDVGFRDQLRRAAVSIASNIAEGKERARDNRRVFPVFVYSQGVCR
jgi:hypothetical protein